MSSTLRAAVAALALAAVAAVVWIVVGASGPSGSGTPAAADPPDPADVARTALPGLAPASGEPRLPGLEDADPRPGTVTTLPGPFDDRFALHGLRVHGGIVSGRLHVTSDVSDLLELQVLVGFYDEHGDLLGTGRTTYHLDEETADLEHEGPPSELETFRVVAPHRFADRVASAAVGVPVLVNE